MRAHAITYNRNHPYFTHSLIISSSVDGAHPFQIMLFVLSHGHSFSFTAHIFAMFVHFCLEGFSGHLEMSCPRSLILAALIVTTKTILTQQHKPLHPNPCFCKWRKPQKLQVSEIVHMKTSTSIISHGAKTICVVLYVCIIM